jgi:3-deoxy-manno-octulosonate cytidylyltransferase (CMP-KDO synthetase)
MIHRVYERCMLSSANKVVVATDDQRIATSLDAIGAPVVMTSATHLNGTSRCAEVLSRLEEEGESFDWLVNVQGDEPFINPEEINELIEAGKLSEAAVLTRLVKESEQQVNNPNVVKAVVGQTDINTTPVLYFSRAAIPFVREKKQNGTFYRHIGIYAFRCSKLHELTALPPSPLETTEHLEQLRWLENGYRIDAVISDQQNVAPAVDHPDDLSLVNKFLKKHPDLK